MLKVVGREFPLTPAQLPLVVAPMGESSVEGSHSLILIPALIKGASYPLAKSAPVFSHRFRDETSQGWDRGSQRSSVSPACPPYLLGDMELLARTGLLPSSRQVPGAFLVVAGQAAGFEEHEVALGRLRTKAKLVAVAWGATIRDIKVGGCARGGLCCEVGCLEAIRGGPGPGTAAAATSPGTLLSTAPNGCEDEDGQKEGEGDGAQGDKEVECEWGGGGVLWREAEVAEVRESLRHGLHHRKQEGHGG